MIDKGKQKEDVIQDKEIFPYKLYATLSKPTISELVFMQEEINNLEKVLKTLQSPTKTIPFLLLSYYKTIQQNREKNIQYWKEIIAEFIKQKHNLYTSQQEFPIKIYSEELPHELFFIVLMLWEEIVIKPTKKLTVSYVVGNLAFLDWSSWGYKC